jgi:hypothetical protein
MAQKFTVCLMAMTTTIILPADHVAERREWIFVWGRTWKKWADRMVFLISPM